MFRIFRISLHVEQLCILQRKTNHRITYTFAGYAYISECVGLVPVIEPYLECGNISCLFIKMIAARFPKAVCPYVLNAHMFGSFSYYLICHGSRYGFIFVSVIWYKRFIGCPALAVGLICFNEFLIVCNRNFFSGFALLEFPACSVLYIADRHA